MRLTIDINDDKVTVSDTTDSTPKPQPVEDAAREPPPEVLRAARRLGAISAGHAAFSDADAGLGAPLLEKDLIRGFTDLPVHKNLDAGEAVEPADSDDKPETSAKSSARKR